MKLRPLAAVLAAAVALLCSVVAQARVNPGTSSAVTLAEPQPTGALTVAILADRTVGAEPGLAVLERAVEEIRLLKPDVVFHIGDFVEGYTRDMDRWERDIGQVKAILSRIDAPFFAVPGNHDVVTGTDNPSDRRGEDMFKRYFGPLYYSVDVGPAHFIVLYTDESLGRRPVRFSREQLDWLRSDLAQSDGRDTYVLLHRPMWEEPGANWDEVHALLRQHKVRAVIAGHYHHYYKSIERDGIQYYVIGVTGGQLFSPELAGGLEHYVLMRVQPGSYSIALVKPGAIEADDYVAEADYHAMAALRYLNEDEVGPTHAVPSPENAPVDTSLDVAVTNPLADAALPVTVRGLPARGWRWAGGPVLAQVPPQAHEHLALSLQGSPIGLGSLSVPEIEVQFDYTDSKGRVVPIVLRRRVPVQRSLEVSPSPPAVSVDGLGDEQVWRSAPVLTTHRWRVSPYETDEPGPTFRVLCTAAGLYLYCDSPDTRLSAFRADRMVSDALFIGARPADGSPSAALGSPPVVIIYPFATGLDGSAVPASSPEAVQALWDEVAPVGASVTGVYCAARAKPGGGWTCEALIPWGLLLPADAMPDGPLAFNVGAWDNDGELFSELHSWAPTDSLAHWGRLAVRTAAQQ